MKRNILNEMRATNMNLTELRFFAIYLSRINPQNLDTRVVRFPLADFKAIMELGRVNAPHFKKNTDSLLCKIVHVPNERTGGYAAFQLFKKCVVDTDENGEWYVEINAHDDALPLMFDFKNEYMKYPLWCALRLRSTNRLRMYELLKQRENIGYRIFTVENLKEELWLKADEYPAFKDFRIYVLDACQKALAENTDIKFTYEPYGKKGRGGKILSLKFTIEKNTDYKDHLSLDKFIKQEHQLTFDEDTEAAKEYENNKDKQLWGGFIPGDRLPDMDDDVAEKIKSLGHCVNFEFTWAQMDSILKTLDLAGLYGILQDVNDGSRVMAWLSNLYADMCRRYDEKQNTKDRIKNRFKYFTGMIKKDSKSALDALNMVY